MAVTIKTDGKWKKLLYGYELPKKQRKEFDYLTDEEFDVQNFARYRGNYYDVSEFQIVPRIESEDGPKFAKWDGYSQETYFSGVLIKLSSDGEQYKIGRFYS
jgi:hypothetical protein